MNKDINIGKLRQNCFRQSKVAGEFMLQLRMPGALIDSEYLLDVNHIAKNWGNGTFHAGSRQTLNIPGIKYENIDNVNNYIEKYIKKVEVENCNCNMTVTDKGYPYIGPRNIMACIGNVHCIKGNINTQELAKKIEPLIYPYRNHIKLSISGCPNDCGKGHFQDFGILGEAKIDYHPERCIGCGACVKACEHYATRVLSMNKNGTVDKDPCCCVGCAECVLACPNSAWTRNEKKFYRVLIGGRTGKQTPRMGETFLNWASEEVVIGIFSNWQKFASWAIDYKAQYLHGGHLIDRAGYNKFKEIILDGIELNPECIVAERILWSETEYRSKINVKKLEDHKTVPSDRPFQDIIK